MMRSQPPALARVGRVWDKALERNETMVERKRLNLVKRNRRPFGHYDEFIKAKAAKARKRRERGAVYNPPGIRNLSRVARLLGFKDYYALMQANLKHDTIVQGQLVDCRRYLVD
jgi:hypothetical protein